MKTGVERRTGRGTAGGGRGIWEAAGQVERGAKDLLGFKVPEAKKWRAKFPRAGGTWGAKTPLGGDFVLPPEQRAGMGSQSRAKGCGKNRVKK